MRAHLPARLIALFIWSLVAATAAGMALLALPLRLVAPPSIDPTRRVFDACSRVVWGRLPFWLNPFWSLEVRGAERLRGPGPFLLVPNHQSLVDVLAVQGLPLQVKWVTSGRFFRVPVLAFFMRTTGYIGVDPQDMASVRRMMREVCGWLTRGVSVALFPEGTRSPDGEVGPFQTGPFRIALETGATVVPVAIDGTREALPKGSWLPLGRAPWRIRVRILEPIPASSYRGLSSGALARRVQASVVEGLGELRAPSPRAEALRLSGRPPASLASGGDPP